MAAIIQGTFLEITVVSCNKLKDTNWMTAQDPYVILEYGSIKYRTNVCQDGGTNPTFNEKFTISLMEGVREISVSVWSKNTMKSDVFIGGGRIQLHKVLAEGYDDSPWMLERNSTRFAGEVKVIMHYDPAKAGWSPRRSPHHHQREEICRCPPPPPQYTHGPNPYYPPPVYIQYAPPPNYPPTPPHHHHFPSHHPFHHPYNQAPRY